MNVDWPNKIVTVYKTDTFMSLVSGNLYDMDTDGFRLALKAEEDGEVGMSFKDITKHNTESLLGGIIYARQIEFINGYTVTLDDASGTDQWICNLTASNNNIGDVLNYSLVQLRTNNSAGLQKVVSGSGVTAQDKLDIADKVWEYNGP